MLKISIITIVKEVKEIYSQYVTLVKSGGFYRVYGKDAYIISNLFEYKVKKEQEVITCGFPIKSLKKVEAKLEQKKINSLVLDSRDNYNVEEKVEFKNLNTYDKQYEESKIYVNNQIRIDNIYHFLEENARKIELKNMLKEFEEIICKQKSLK